MGTMLFSGCLESPLGPVAILSDGSGLKRVDFGRIEGDFAAGDAVVREAIGELSAYFSGDLSEFDLPLCPDGTEFQKSVWDALLQVPYGRVESYGELAARIGRPKAYRAVGSAVGSNPIAVIIPCHRIIRADGKAGNYGGGVFRKHWLLDREGVRGTGEAYRISR